MTASIQTAPSRPPRSRWQDGDTMLSFALFAAVVFGLLAWRIADSDNWIAVAAAAVEPLPIDRCSRDRD
jgi:hypothetical protein